jgi:hypothetical protein
MGRRYDNGTEAWKYAESMESCFTRRSPFALTKSLSRIHLVPSQTLNKPLIHVHESPTDEPKKAVGKLQ